MFLTHVLRHGRAARVLAGVLLASGAQLFAQAPQTSGAQTAAKADAKPAAELPAAREIIDRYIAAIGGRQAVLSHTSMHVTGTFSVAASGMHGTVEMFSAAKPDRAVQRVTIPGVGELATGYDGEHGWTVNPMTGPMLQQGKELDQTRFEADFYGELRDPKKYKRITTVEKTAFEGRPCFKLSLVHPDGTEDFEFYDADTSLRAGGITTHETPMGAVTSTSVEGEYKKFGNLLQPTSLLLKAMGVEQKITVSSVEYDNVPPTIFDPPAVVKALMK